MTKENNNFNEQFQLQFSSIRNVNFLSNHWLETRLPIEPEWDEFKKQSIECCTKIIDIWEKEKDLVAHYGDEAGLEEAFIQWIFRALGWKIKYQTYLYGREPDYALFSDIANKRLAIKLGRRNENFWKFPEILADAKAWHVNLDRPITRGNAKEYPPEQIEWYLDRSRLDFAILTNGQLWRLIPRVPGPGNPRFQTFLEVDLPHLIKPLLDFPQFTFDGEEFANFRRFYFLFSPMAFGSINGRSPLIYRAIQGSSEYRLGVSEALKEQVLEAYRSTVEGFYLDKNNNLSSEDQLTLCRNEGLVFLYRLLFVMFAEDRGVLPVGKNKTYTDNYSLRRYRDEIAHKLNNIWIGRDNDYDKNSYLIWEDLFTLFDLVDRGNKRYGVGEFNGGLYSPHRSNFFDENKISDWYVSRILDCLSRTVDKLGTSKELGFVDYRDLSINHIGSVYEGLIELLPKFAHETMIVIKSKSSKTQKEIFYPLSKPLPKGFIKTGIVYVKGSIYLQTDKGERRMFGSYYTPDHIVDYIVRETLSPLCQKIDKQLNLEISNLEKQLNSCKRAKDKEVITSNLEKLKGDFDDRVLELRILDPAMGSGHFLIRACEYLAEEIATNPNTADPDADQLLGDEPTLNYWKRRVVESCVLGVDLNPLAVELAKVALWLATIDSGPPLSFLNHHLRLGNSLLGGRVEKLGVLPDSPPIFRDAYQKQVIEALPNIISTMEKIEGSPSRSAADIKKKETLLSKNFNQAIGDLRNVANIWFGTLVSDKESDFTDEEYSDLVQGIDKNSITKYKDKIYKISSRLQSEKAELFHWELEFPNLFFGKSKLLSNGGFDAIVGNPPYDVVEKERGKASWPHHLLRSYIEISDEFDGAKGGKA